METTAPATDENKAETSDSAATPEVEKKEPAAVDPALQPRDLWVDELHSLTVLELHERFAQLKVRANLEKTRHYLVCDLLRTYHQLGFRLLAEGVTEIAGDGCGFIRYPRYSFRQANT